MVTISAGLRGSIGAVALGPPQNRNRIHRFYGDLCFSSIKKSSVVFLFILGNKNKKRRTVIT
jgi:hypothetical protein